MIEGLLFLIGLPVAAGGIYMALARSKTAYDRVWKLESRVDDLADAQNALGITAEFEKVRPEYEARIDAAMEEYERLHRVSNATHDGKVIDLAKVRWRQ